MKVSKLRRIDGKLYQRGGIGSKELISKHLKELQSKYPDIKDDFKMIKLPKKETYVFYSKVR